MGIEALFESAAEHMGVFTADEARNAGVTRRILERYIRTERIVRAFRGVYCVTPTQREASIVAAWRFVGQDAVASHETALQLYDLAEIEPRYYEFMVPRETRLRRRGPLFRLHIVDVMPTTRIVRGVPATTAARAIVDTAPLGDLTDTAVAQALDRQLATDAELRSEAFTRGPEILVVIDAAIAAALR